MSLFNLHNINKLYTEIAASYDEYAILSRLCDEELLARLDLININVKNLLSLGCGSAQNTKALLHRFPKINLHLLDQSEAMLALAKKQKPWFKKINYIKACAEEMEIEKNSIDLVISNLMLPSCQEPDLVLGNVQTILRENGLFTFTTLGPDSFKEMRQAIHSAGISLHKNAFGHLTDMHDVGDALGRAGFIEPVLDVDIHTLTFSGFQELWKELSSTGCIFQSFTEIEIAKIQNNYPVRNLGTAQACFPVTFEIVYAQAWAGDGINRARTPEEFSISLSSIKKSMNKK